MTRIEDFIYDHIGLIMLAILAGVVWLMLTVLASESEERQRLIDQCVQDGHKEHECVAMLRRNEPQGMPVPVVIPTR